MIKRKRWDEVLDRLPTGYATVVEVGVWRGALALRLLKARPQLQMILVDLWRAGAEHPAWVASGAEMAHRTPGEIEGFYREVIDGVRPYAGRVRILRMESVAAAAEVTDGSCDAVFLDADHSYASVLWDIHAWRPKVRSGGWIGGHDYDHPRFPGVKAAVDANFPFICCGADRTWFAPC